MSFVGGLFVRGCVLTLNLSYRGKAKDDLLSGAFLDGGEDDSDVDAAEQPDLGDSDEDEDESEIADDESFASLDEEGALYVFRPPYHALTRPN